MLQAGKTPGQIRQKYPGTTSPILTYYRKQLGLPPFPTGRRSGLTKNPRAQKIIRLLRAGATPRQIVRRIPDVDRSRISYFRSKLGLPPFRRGAVFDVKSRRKAAKLRQAGLTFKQIGEIFGVTRQRAHQLLQPDDRFDSGLGE